VIRVVYVALLALTLAGCTSIGVYTRAQAEHDYGSLARMRVCVLKSDGITSERMQSMVDAVNQEFAPYRIFLEVVWVRPWTRPGFTHDAIFGDIVRRDLEAPCDRLIALVDRNVGDLAWGLLLPEILGEVDSASGTRGFVVAALGSLNQLGAGPRDVIVHEFYHLVGCPHGLTQTKCYARIATLKAALNPAEDFFPSMNIATGEIVPTRQMANDAVRKSLADAAAKKGGVRVEQPPPAPAPAAPATPPSPQPPPAAEPASQPANEVVVRPI
jgi:hypothetical protein